MSLLAPVLLLGLLHHQLGSSSSRKSIYGFYESHGFHLPHLHSVVSTGVDSESPVCSSGDTETCYGRWQDSVGRYVEADLGHFHTAVSRSWCVTRYSMVFSYLCLMYNDKIVTFCIHSTSGIPPFLDVPITARGGFCLS